MSRVACLALVILVSLSSVGRADPAHAEGRAASVWQMLTALHATSPGAAAGGCSHPLRRAPLLCRATAPAIHIAAARL